MPLEDIRRERAKKLEAYRRCGFDPYPASAARTAPIAEIKKAFSKLKRSKKSVSLVGRLKAWREHGGATFGDLADASGKIQIYLASNGLGKELYQLALDTVDIGDFLEVSGNAFHTQRREPTLRVVSWRLVAKALRPLPEKWHGLKDIEERFRKRYLDLLMNDEVRERFLLRSQILRALRAFFDGQGFVEVETPMLQHVPGGALARPFLTHHNALNIDLYLRIAPELPLKELLVGGLERVYELGKSFRNEGIDAEHNPEFTSIEWYAAYWDEEDMMRFVERCFGHLAKTLKLKPDITFDGKTVSFGRKFPRIEFKEVLRRHALILDYDRETRDSLLGRARQFGIEAGRHEPKGKIADEIYKKICRPRLIQPTFVVNHPTDISPLAKRREGAPQEVRRLQLVAGGVEILNAYAELNDPLEQRVRFEEQEKVRRAGAEETHPLDEEFIEALEYGMPPAAGAAIGIDRLVMLLTDTKNIREVVLFPTLRPR